MSTTKNGKNEFSVLSLLTLALCLVRSRNARYARYFIFALTCIAIALHLSSVMFRYGEYQLRRVMDRNAMIPSPPSDEISTIFAQLFPAAMCGLTILNIGSKLQNSAPRGALIAIAVSACFYGAAAMLDYVEFFARTSHSNSTQTTEYNEFLSYIYTTVPMAIVITLACVLSAVTTLKYTAVILQSLARANQFHCVLWLAKGYSKRDIPIRCILILSTIQILISAIGSYDILCIPTTVFYLFAYALFNFYVFLVKLSDPDIPSPPTLLSLAISGSCFLASIYTNRHLALFVASIFAISYCILLYISSRDKNEDGEECAKSMYPTVLEQMHELQQEPESRRHFHPQILLLSGSPAARPGLVDFAHSITRGKSLLICGYIIPQDPCSRSYLLQLKIDKQINDWLKAREVNAFGAAICCKKQTTGANILLQTAGLGRLRPNILMVGFKTGWEKQSREVIAEYYEMLSNAFDKQVGLIVFRNEISGFDVTSSIRKNGAPINDDEDLADYVDR
uniref:SLC12 domain-containing protein n=1 Tax=Caenorhabditis tropicalis TaxID=1561998 RepID=A0A1I7UJ51_9PELO